MRHKRQKYLSPKETLELITTTSWATFNDIYLLSGKGKNATAKDIKIMRDKIERENYKLPKGHLPMEIVIDYYNINISYLKRIVNLMK